MGIVKAVCISEEKGTAKTNVGTAAFAVACGIVNDAHRGPWHRQISLLSYDKISAFRQRGADVAFGAFGENLVVEGIDFRSLPVGTRFRCGDVLLEMTQIGKECHQHCRIYHQVGDCIMPREGVFATVLEAGRIKVGDEMTVLPPEKNALPRAAVVTLSDKGSLGQRSDESGPAAKEILEKNGYRVIEMLLLPDEQKRIEKELLRLADGRQAALVITTGGTGFSERDRTPEATLAVATRNAPGIAEAIRSYSMQFTARAMLGRGVSVIRNRTLIVNLPGSPKAVRECLGYLLPTLEHGLAILVGSASDCARNDDPIAK